MNDVVIISAKSDLIGVEVECFKKQIVEVLAENPKKMILDLSNIAVIDSSGIGTLVAAKNSAANTNCEVVLKGVSDDIFKMFKIMRLTEHFVFEN